jgi:hypothetical protein
MAACGIRAIRLASSTLVPPGTRTPAVGRSRLANRSFNKG